MMADNLVGVALAGLDKLWMQIVASLELNFAAHDSIGMVTMTYESNEESL